MSALAALVVGVLGAGTTSATALPAVETRVGASTPASVHVVGPHECITGGQRWGNAPPQAETVVGQWLLAVVAVVVWVGDHGAKFASDDTGQVQGWIARGLQSDGVQFLPNQLDDTLRAIVPGGGVVGTRGQEFIRVIVTGDGRVINAFPVNVR